MNELPSLVASGAAQGPAPVFPGVLAAGALLSLQAGFGQGLCPQGNLGLCRMQDFISGIIPLAALSSPVFPLHFSCL